MNIKSIGLTESFKVRAKEASTFVANIEKINGISSSVHIPCKTVVSILQFLTFYRGGSIYYPVRFGTYHKRDYIRYSSYDYISTRVTDANKFLCSAYFNTKVDTEYYWDTVTKNNELLFPPKSMGNYFGVRSLFGFTTNAFWRRDSVVIEDLDKRYIYFLNCLVEDISKKEGEPPLNLDDTYDSSSGNVLLRGEFKHTKYKINQKLSYVIRYLLDQGSIDFGGMCFDYLDLSKLTFIKTNFKLTSFIGTNLSGCVFQGCNFDKNIFYNTDLSGARFINCKIKRPDIFEVDKVKLNDTLFIECVISFSLCYIKGGEIFVDCHLDEIPPKDSHKCFTTFNYPRYYFGIEGLDPVSKNGIIFYASQHWSLDRFSLLSGKNKKLPDYLLDLFTENGLCKFPDKQLQVKLGNTLVNLNCQISCEIPDVYSLCAIKISEYNIQVYNFDLLWKWIVKTPTKIISKLVFDDGYEMIKRDHKVYCPNRKIPLKEEDFLNREQLWDLLSQDDACLIEN